MRSCGGALSVCRLKRGWLDNGCYRSVPSMLLVSTIESKPPSGSWSMRSRSLVRVFPLLASLVLVACTPSNGSEKKGGHPGMGMPPPEVLVAEVKAQSLPLTFEYV